MKANVFNDLISESRRLAEAKYATVDVMAYYDPARPTYRTVWVSKAEWASINYMDYIEVDHEHNLLPEYASLACADALRAIVTKSL